ncbi:hypothetical protein Poly51_25920 [Rubripirellula tenax]|uniref:Nucleotidyltransferase family protein n=1 Tax=Rubripirellula tenax TaxID=2528015 RepID=A0A5C6F614_9BACT|nr:hypothetical protein [Rubripirellula tenax]TWU56675.1 hypothetical protein Poly51_25920 [Rubripirellula tenax]
MTDSLLSLFDVLAASGVSAAIIGGHAVNIHGYVRSTEDVDVVFVRNEQSERALFGALTSIGAYWIGDEIDPATGIEKTYPVNFDYIRSSALMMLGTDRGFLDIFDHIPGLPHESAADLVEQCITVGGRRFASLAWLRRMKEAAGRPIDLIDLERLPLTDRIN